MKYPAPSAVLLLFTTVSLVICQTPVSAADQAIYTRMRNSSGLILGGLGTGSVEINPDGMFGQWDILNCGVSNPGSPCSAGGNPPSMSSSDLLFLARVKMPDGRVLVRYLGFPENYLETYSLSWVRPIQAIKYEGHYPIATLTYVDEELPVQIQARTFSPFVPLDSRASGTPGFYVQFTARNLSADRVEVSIMGMMKNPLGSVRKYKTRNSLKEFGKAKAIVLGADNVPSGDSSFGNLTFGAKGDNLTHVLGCYESETKKIRPGNKKLHGCKTLTLLHPLRDRGSLPNLNMETEPVLPEDFNPTNISAGDKKKLIEYLSQLPSMNDKCQIWKDVDERLMDRPEFIEDVVRNVSDLKTSGSAWGSAAICNRMVLGAEETGETLFILGWHFPNHITSDGANIGHSYASWFGNSTDVFTYMLDNHKKFNATATAFVKAFAGSSLPKEVSDAVTGQLTTLAKSTWWTKAGHFGVWEGAGCCGLNTIGVAHQGSFPLIAMFPELETSLLRHGAKFQREDGRIYHSFTPNFGKVDDAWQYYVDANSQFTFMVARDYLWTGDKGFLKNMYPHVVAALECLSKIDTDGDGLPDQDARKSAYDQWSFEGSPIYIANLYLSALKCSIRLAHEMGDAPKAARWQADYNRGLDSMERLLWNGDYYALWKNGAEIDQCCMSDQLSGDWYAAACGWGPVARVDRMKTALNNVMKCNFAAGQGLINGGYPPGKPRKIVSYGNYQAVAPWTGTEYTVAALMFHLGMVHDGLRIVKDIDDRYRRAGRVWNHEECGGHYSRAMSSWTLLIALSGFKWDCPAGALSFAPVIDERDCQYPFFTPQAWGSYSRKGKTAQLIITGGSLSLKSLNLPQIKDATAVTAAVGETKVDGTLTAGPEGIKISFRSEVVLSPERSLTIELQ